MARVVSDAAASDRKPRRLDPAQGFPDPLSRGQGDRFETLIGRSPLLPGFHKQYLFVRA